MNSISLASFEEIQHHENVTCANVRLGGYTMDEKGITDELKCFKVTLDDDDLPRLFLLWDFSVVTKGGSCRLIDSSLEDSLNVAMDRMPEGSANEIDLSTSSHMEPTGVTCYLNAGAITIIDGNHRLLAHYLRHQSVAGASIYIAVHNNMHSLPIIPMPARHYNIQNHVFEKSVYLKRKKLLQRVRLKFTGFLKKIYKVLQRKI